VAPDVQAALAQAAAEDGVVLGPGSFDWLSEQGHVGLERVAKARQDPNIVQPVIAAVEALGAIHARLRGDLSVLHASRANLLLPVALVHAPTGTVVAVDDVAHFSTSRLAALELYQPDAAIAFDVEAYKALCREWSARADRTGGGLPAKGFGFGGLPRERAYHDALLDLGAPAMGLPPVVRIAAPAGDGAAAYRRHGAALRERFAA
jgi:hypothetical protein